LIKKKNRKKKKSQNISLQAQKSTKLKFFKSYCWKK